MCVHQHSAYTHATHKLHTSNTQALYRATAGTLPGLAFVISLQLPNLSRNANSTAPPQPYLNMNKVHKVEAQGSCPSYQGLLMKIRLLSGTAVLFEYRHGIPKGFNIYSVVAVSYTHLRAHETDSYLVCRLLL